MKQPCGFMGMHFTFLMQSDKINVLKGKAQMRKRSE